MTRVAPVTHCAVTQDCGTGRSMNGQPATTYGAGCVHDGLTANHHARIRHRRLRLPPVHAHHGRALMEQESRH